MSTRTAAPHQTLVGLAAVPGRVARHRGAARTLRPPAAGDARGPGGTALDCGVRRTIGGGMSSAATPAEAGSSGAAVPIMLTELRLPTMKRLWADLAAQSNKEGWPAERLLHTLLGHEMAERETRRLARARADSGLPPGKTLAQFDFAAVPAVSKAHVMALAEADAWISQGHNLLAFGPPGTGKTHLMAGIGHALIDRGHKVLFVRTSELVQRLQAARRDLRLPAELDYSAIGGLSNEVREKLKAVRPTTLGQAGRIEGVTPGALTALLAHVRRAAKATPERMADLTRFLELLTAWNENMNLV
eukprot:gene21358-41387_t